VAALPLGVEAPTRPPWPTRLKRHRFAVIGTPDDAARRCSASSIQSGGFGTFLHDGPRVADTAATRRSYELLARYVMPRFRGPRSARRPAANWGRREPPRLHRRRHRAVIGAMQKHAEEKPQQQS